MPAPMSVSALIGSDPLLLGAEMRDDLLAEQPHGVDHLIMRRRTDSAEQDHLLDPERFVQFDKSNAFGRCADAELLAAVAHLTRRRLARVRPGGQTLIAGVIALVIRRDGSRIIIAPDQARPFALL